MQKSEIVQLLEEKHQDLYTWLKNQPDEKWLYAPKGKWTTGQHILHLVDVLKKVNYALSLPKFLLKYKFGKANREVRKYDTIIHKYQTKLSENIDKAEKFNSYLKVPILNDKDKLVATLKNQQKKLQRTTQKWKDKHLDTVILPHPLLGKMPVREMIMFVGYHTEHHAKILKEKY